MTPLENVSGMMGDVDSIIGEEPRMNARDGEDASGEEEGRAPEGM